MLRSFCLCLVIAGSFVSFAHADPSPSPPGSKRPPPQKPNYAMDLENTRAYYEKEILEKLKKKITLIVEGAEGLSERELRNYDFVVRQVGSAVPELIKDSYNEKWFRSAVSQIRFRPERGPSEVQLRLSGSTIEVRTDLLNAPIKAGEAEVEKVIAAWVPRLGAGRVPAKTQEQIAYWKKEYSTWVHTEVDVDVRWSSLDRASPKAAERLAELTGEVLTEVTRAFATESLKPKIRFTPKKVVVEAIESGRNYTIEKEAGPALRVRASLKFLEGDEFIVPRERVQALLTGAP